MSARHDDRNLLIRQDLKQRDRRFTAEAITGFGDIGYEAALPKIKPRPNTTSMQHLDDAQILCEYDYEKAEVARGPEHPLPGPGCAALVTITALSVNGEWIDPSYFAADTLAHLEQLISEEIAQEEADERDEYDEREREDL